MYRIITGKWKGKKIGAPKNFDVRPTTDFAKEGLFSMLQHKKSLDAIHVLDLFAGIGSISLEFASRGALSVSSIEANQKHAGFIHETSKTLELSRVQVFRADVFEILKKKKLPKNQFDYIFADPPFEYSKEQYMNLIELSLNDFWLKNDGYLILEHGSHEVIEHPLLVESRKFGHITFSFFQMPNV